MNISERFWGKVEINSFDKCWDWIACKDGRGYGQIRNEGKGNRAHRIAYEMAYGEIPNGLHVCHTCDNPLCCNPTHLFTGTHSDNMADKAAKGRTNIPQGEEQYSSKLTEADIIAIQADTRFQRVIANEYGVSQPHISAIKLGKKWKHVDAH